MSAGPALQDRPRQRSLFENIVALGVLQLSFYLVPLATAAYTARVLGIEQWGRVALVQVVLTYFSLVVSWGFSWSGTRKIATIQDDVDAVSRVALATMAGQALLALITTAALLALVAFVPWFGRDADYYLFGIGLLFATAAFPSWLLTGLERMREFSFIQIGSRLLALALIVVFVRRPSDAPLIIAINAGVGLLAGLATFAWLMHSGLIRWHLPSGRLIARELREGASIFASTTAVGLYTNVAPIILGAVIGPVATGYFVMADRLRLAAQSMLAPVSNALFPRMSRLTGSDPMLARLMLRRSAAGLIGVSVLISIGLFVTADLLATLVGGAAFLPAGQVLRWLALLPMIMSVSTFLGLQLLLPHQRNKAFNVILGMASLISLTLIYPLIQWKGVDGAAITLLATESFVSLAMLTYTIRSGLHHGPAVRAEASNAHDASREGTRT